MDNFNLQDYLASGKLHATSKTLTEGLKTSTNPQENLSEKEDSKKGNESEQKRMEGAIKDDRDHIKNLKKDIEDNEKKLARLKKDYKKDIVKENEEEDLEEDARTDAEEEGYKDGIKDEKEDAKKMKVSELKAKIKETILAELTLDEAEEEVDVDIDVEDEVEVEAGADDIEIERPGVKTTVDVGLSPEEEVVQDSLTAAMKAAQELGNTKLADQIGNTITFFTREFVVGQNTD
jgi:dGTP triphosphohydrolase